MYDDDIYRHDGEDGRGYSSRRNRRRTNRQEAVNGHQIYYPQPGEARRSMLNAGYDNEYQRREPRPSILDSFFMSPWDTRMRARDEPTLVSDSPFNGMFGMMRGMMMSMDRLFDDFATSTMHFSEGHASTFECRPGSGTYFYQSKTRSVGPDGRMREETVQTRRGSNGHPETRRTVRHGNNVEANQQGNASSRTFRHSAMPRTMYDDEPRQGYVAREPDVVIEELDEYGNVIEPTDERSSVAVASGEREGAPSRYSGDDYESIRHGRRSDGHFTSHGRWHDQYNSSHGYRR